MMMFTDFFSLHYTPAGLYSCRFRPIIKQNTNKEYGAHIMRCFQRIISFAKHV